MTIAKLLVDVGSNKAGTPIKVLEDTTGGWLVEFPDREQAYIDGSKIYALEPEETISRLAKLASIKRDTLFKAANQGRLMARKSGLTWLSTVTAVEYLYDKENK